MLFSTSFNKYNLISKYIITKVIVFSVFIATFFSFFPHKVSASISSVIYGLLGDEVNAKVVDDPGLKNSQNMLVLKAIINNDPKSNISTLEPVPVSQNALIAEIGPLGTSAEVEEPINTLISVYTIRKGDTLSSIAELFDVSVNTILWANSLNKNSELKEGQNLVILPISGIRHTVKEGDNINSIVSKYKADLEEVLKYNDITLKTKLKLGSVVLIPDGELVVPVKTKQVKGSMATNNPLHDANGPSYPGYYIRPIVGGTRSQGLHGYNAVDIAAPVGTSIIASAKGKVLVSVTGGWNGGYGNFIIISHDNGTQTLYSHNSKNLVKAGDSVDKGDVIAKVGSTGHATGPHVHFEIRGAKNPF